MAKVLIKEPKLLVIAREDKDWAFARTEESDGAYGYGIDADWEDAKPKSRGVIFSDRQLYQPGEKAWFTGFADYLQNGTIQQDKNANYQLTLVSPDGQNTNLGTQTTNQFGTFSLELPIKNNQRLGYYTIQAKGKNGQAISGDFRVAEFKPPNFKVELALDKEFALIDDQVEAKATSHYLFGSPVEGGKAKYFVTRQPFHPPYLVNTVYAEQPISTRFSDNRRNVVVEQQALTQPKGWGYGGGFAAGAASTRIRKDFQALAYYNGSILADATGKAQVTFKLPDDLTTWRVIAIATDGNLRFGNSEATFITTKPLVTNAILPQFARPGDRILGGLSVTNNTGKAGDLTIHGEVICTDPIHRLCTQFEGRNPTTTALRTKVESATHAYRFPMKAGSVGVNQVRFTTQLNRTTADAFEVPLEIKPLEVTEQVIETGVTENQVKIPLNVEKNTVPEAGGLDVQLANTLIPQIKAPAQQVLDNNDLPFTEPAASQLIISSNLQTLSQKFGQTFVEFNFHKQTSQAIERLQKLQRPDGGFAAFPGQQKSDPWVSSYAAESLAKTNQVFPGLVDAGMVSRLKAYLQKVLANPGQYEFCQQQLCKNQLQLHALTALAELGDQRNSFLADIYRQRDAFDLVTQIKLARYISRFPEWQNQSKQLSNQLQDTIYDTGRTAVVSLPRSWEWMSSPTAAQAQALRLFITQHGKLEFIDGLLQSLLVLRRDGTWQTSYDNAQALTALVEYSQLQPTPPNFVAKVQLAGKKLGEQRFEGYRNPSLFVKVPMAELPRGRHDLLLQKSGKGTLHYLAAYRYRLQGNQVGRFNGLRVTREIRRVGEEKVLQKLGLYAFDQPLSLESGQVFDIGVEIIADHPVEHVVISDPLPGGFEAVDASFQTSTAALQAIADSWEVGFKTNTRE